jgi:hypothetical protein
MTTPSGIIELLGGTRPVLDKLNALRLASAGSMPLTTVASWAARESIPIEHWPALIELAREKRIAGVTYESLTLAHVNARKAA